MTHSSLHDLNIIVSENLVFLSLMPLGNVLYRCLSILCLENVLFLHHTCAYVKESQGGGESDFTGFKENGK